jgi:ABC-type uncharacterized transport system substrate-binding protein
MKKHLAVAICACAMTVASTFVSAAEYTGKKVLFIDSYHEGYPWSDGITAGVEGVIGASGAELKVIRMDTKRNGSDEFKKEAALKAKAVIEEFKPDVVIAADDNASKYLIVPYYKDAALPFVFCGVNWDASGYGFPASNVTGMVEVMSLDELVNVLKTVAKGERLALLTSDVATERKDADNVKTVLGVTFAEEVYVKTFDEWKAAFSDLQGKADMLFISNNAGIDGWDDAAAAEFVQANSQIPTGTVYDFMAPYALMTYGKVAQEQGQWAAESALNILSGTAPSSIAVAKNTQGTMIINALIAEKLQADLPADLIESADRVIE